MPPQMMTAMSCDRACDTVESAAKTAAPQCNGPTLNNSNPTHSLSLLFLFMESFLKLDPHATGCRLQPTPLFQSRLDNNHSGSPGRWNFSGTSVIERTPTVP